MTRTVEDMYPSNAASPAPDSKRSLLLPAHTAAAPATINISHAQLRHLISCPSQRGIVYYIGGKSICERDVLNPAFPPRVVIDTEFFPTCFAAVAVGESPPTILFAAGGYNSELHLSLHAFVPSSQAPSSSTPSPIAPKLLWRTAHRLQGRSEIVNSIMFTPAGLTDDTRRAPGDMRIVVSGNDATVKLFEVALRRNVDDQARLQACGSIKLETPVNHMSFSPDGRTLLCVGDTPKAYLFQVTPGAHVTFSPLAVYTLPPPPPRPLMHHPPSSPTTPPDNFASQACFSTAWSADGLKFAVASQEGQLCVWDVRSARPLLTYWTPFRRNSGAAGGLWEWEDLGGPLRAPSTDPTNNGPDSGIRNVRFSAGEGGRELLVFVEHTVNVHVMDARTLDLASHSVFEFPEMAAPAVPAPLVPAEPQAQLPLYMASPSPEGETVIIERSRPGTPPIPVITQWTVDDGHTGTLSRSPTPPFGYARRRSPSPVLIIGGRRSRSPSTGPRATVVTHRTPSRSPSPPLAPPAQVIWSRNASPPPAPPAQVVWPRTRSRSRSRERVVFPVQGRPHVPRRRFLLGTEVVASDEDEHDEDDEGSVRSPPPPVGRASRSPSPGVAGSSLPGWARAHLDADGDVIGNVIRDTFARMSVYRPPRTRTHRTELSREAREALVRQRAAEMRRRAAQDAGRERGGEGLAAVAEGGEPPPVQRPTQLAGLCFDPSGGWVYVASEGGIVEWRVRAREEGRTCWGSGAWA